MISYSTKITTGAHDAYVDTITCMSLILNPEMMNYNKSTRTLEDRSDVLIHLMK